MPLKLGFNIKLAKALAPGHQVPWKHWRCFNNFILKLSEPGLGSHCKRALAPAPAPKLPSIHPLASALVPQPWFKSILLHYAFLDFLVKQTLKIKEYLTSK